jgi:hypothetical protein
MSFVGRNKAKRFLLGCITPYGARFTYGAMRLNKALDLLRPTKVLQSIYIQNNGATFSKVAPLFYI